MVSLHHAGRFATAAVLAIGLLPTAFAATYTDQSSFLAANPGTSLISFAGQTGSFQPVPASPLPFGGATFSGPNLTFVSTNFWGSVDSLLDNRFSGFIRADFAASSAVGFLFASDYGDGTPIVFTAFDGATQIFSQTLTGGGVRTQFSYFGVDGIGSITGFRLSSEQTSTGFASIAELSIGTGGGTTVVPVPASGLLLLGGLGLLGSAARRKHKARAD